MVKGQAVVRANITDITQAKPCVVTVDDISLFFTGDFIRITDLNSMMPFPRGMDELNNKRFKIIVKTESDASETLTNTPIGSYSTNVDFGKINIFQRLGVIDPSANIVPGTALNPIIFEWGTGGFAFIYDLTGTGTLTFTPGENIKSASIDYTTGILSVQTFGLEFNLPVTIVSMTINSFVASSITLLDPINSEPIDSRTYPSYISGGRVDLIAHNFIYNGQ